MPRTQNKSPRILIGISGGVDSSVAAALLVKEGYECAGIFYELWSNEAKLGKAWENNCCSFEAYHDAKKVALKLGIPLFRANIAREFKKHVVDYFIDEYSRGRTPNPCVVCNADLRFGIMLKRALKVYKADYFATGHYAIKDNVYSWKKSRLAIKPRRHTLLCGHDSRKDQSYFLYRLGQKELRHILFPLGGLKKTAVRKIAKQMSLPTASKHDSQEVCFIPKGQTTSFLRQYSKAKKGPIKNKRGKKIGEHEGAFLFTVGQRRGLGSLGHKPHYVLKSDVTTNTVIVSDNHHDLQMNKRCIILNNINLITGPIKEKKIYRARGRHTQKTFSCRVSTTKDGLMIRALDKTELLASGQSLVIYDDGLVVGGGIINKIIDYKDAINENKKALV